MKIMILSRGYPTEQYKDNGIFEFDQAKALVNNGVDIIFAAVDIRSLRRWRRWGFEEKNVEGVKIYAVNLPVGRMPNTIKRWLGYVGLKLLYQRILQREGKPDLIHAHFPLQGYTAVRLKRKTNIPVVVTEHSSAIMAKQIDAEVRYLAAKSYQHADRIIVVSPALKEVVEREFSVKATYIPNMVDTNLFAFMERAHTGSTRFLSVGLLIARKGMDLLVEAFAEINKVYPESRLDIIGDGPEKNRLEHQISKHGLEGKVVLHGFMTREEIAARM
ncbi:MAG: glycosyltransferase family 4 protein, partial [Chloroflexi bacterium]|nr:glycosyltransferase family 4 protein [Chloroflexota bacterium]